MADDKKEGEGHDPIKDLYFFLILFAALVGVWWYMGGPQKADLRGLFINPLPPVGSGDAYGPRFPSTPQTEEPADSGGTSQ